MKIVNLANSLAICVLLVMMCLEQEINVSVWMDT